MNGVDSPALESTVNYATLPVNADQRSSTIRLYNSLPGTETALGLLRVQNDILCSLHRSHATVLVLLDLSAVFHSVDHRVLLERLSFTYGIEGLAHSWLEPYLTGRIQAVKVGDCTFGHRTLQVQGFYTRVPARPDLVYNVHRTCHPHKHTVSETLAIRPELNTFESGIIND